MKPSLLDEFLVQECTLHVQRLLEEAITDKVADHSKFEFNRFEVTIERENGMVVLEDALDATEEGAQRVPLATFAQALSRRTAR